MEIYKKNIMENSSSSEYIINFVTLIELCSIQLSLILNQTSSSYFSQKENKKTTFLI